MNYTKASDPSEYYYSILLLYVKSPLHNELYVAKPDVRM
jgi:hypothetical protein